jgi:hypothetical protein
LREDGLGFEDHFDGRGKGGVVETAKSSKKRAKLKRKKVESGERRRGRKRCRSR